MPERAQWRLHAPPGGFADPWPNALELARALPAGSWTLIGGLMVQLHALHAGLDSYRPTVDVDALLHIETDKVTWSSARSALRQIGYELRQGLGQDSRAHRFTRGNDNIVDVLVADHAGPWAIHTRASGRAVVRAPGGTSALRKTVDCTFEMGDGSEACLSVPDVLGALTLKGGAYLEDARDRDRHLEDGALLAATVEDADELIDRPETWTGSDARRIAVLSAHLPDDHEAWSRIPRARRPRAQASLRILARGPRRQS